ncbi:MAG: cadherin domain-containing protein [Planctomycetaceae bacterium]
MAITVVPSLQLCARSCASYWFQYRRGILELRQLLTSRVRKHRRHFRKAATETLEPRALLSFSAGNVVVFRVTDGGNNNAGLVELVQYPPTAGAPDVNTTSLPAGTGGLTDDLSRNTSGFLNTSSDGQYLVLMGTEAAVGSGITAARRSVYRFDVDRTGRQVASLSGASNDGYNGQSPNGATTFGGAPDSAAAYWTVSPINGPNYSVRSFNYNGTAPYTAVPAQLVPNTTRNVSAFRNVLFAGAPGAVSYFPDPQNATIVDLSGLSLNNGTGSFFLLDRSPTVGMAALNGLDTLYAIDGAAIEKYEYNGNGTTNSWIARGSATFSANLFAVSGRFTGNSVSLVATTAAASNNAVISISDSSGFGGNLTGVAANFTTLYSAGPNRRFKGVQFAPTAPDTTAPTVDIAENDADNVVIVNTPVQYTLTFNEPIQTDNIVSSFFENAGTSAVTIGAPSFPNATTVTFNVTPTSVGTLQLRIKSTAGIRDLATNSLVVPFSDNDTLNVVLANQAPTDITLSNVSIPENSAADTIIGSFTATDINPGDTHTFTLVAGTGSTDNASFTIVGNQLRSSAPLNFETKTSYSIRVRATDAGSLTFEKTFTISVTNVNETPTDITLSSTSIAENQTAPAVVGNFSAVDPDSGDSHTFTLVAGTGDTDNASFSIVAGQLRTATTFNFETKSSYSIRVQATDVGNLTFQKVFTISVTNVNEAPTDITLSSTSIAENQTAPAVVGNFSATDPDAGDSHTFTLVAGTGDTDNASFSIVAGQLRTAASFNFEAKSSYSIRVQTADAGNLTFQKVFTIAVTNVNEAPTDITLSNASIAENQAAGTAIGDFSAVDPDAGDSLTWSLVAGAGGTDNSSFTIVGNQLRSAAPFNFEVKFSYSIRVQARDALGLATPAVFTISVTNINDAPVNAVMSSQSVAEILAPGALVGTLSATDEDAGDSLTWTLVSGDGSADNTIFTLVGNQVRTAATFDFETKSAYTIRVEGRDSANATVVRVFSISITNVTEINSIDVQLGQKQRSFVRYVDMTFDRSEDIQALLSTPGRFRLLRADLNGNNFVAHTPPAFSLTAAAPRTIRIDFGVQGIGGNRNSNIGDGYYELGFDTNGDGSFTSAFDGRKRFYRLLGDVTGDGKVTTADSDAIFLGFGSTNPERDANGDGVVNSNDRTLTQRALGRKLLDSLFATGLDD